MAKKKVTTTTTTVVTTEHDDTTEGMLVNVVMDMSGSMQNVWDDTIGGFNTFLASQKGVPGRCLMSLMVFDDIFETRFTGLDVKEVPDLNKDTYRPRNSTALFDAIGRSIKAVENMPGRPEKVLFVIMTDGGENASKEYRTRDQIAALIRDKEKEGWNFLYLGANQDGFAVGQSMGFAANSSYTYNATSGGTANLYRSVSNSVGAMRVGASFSAATDSLRSDLADDSKLVQDKLINKQQQNKKNKTTTGSPT